MTLFQFDYDLTFSIFFMNADKTVYGRYGTRSSVEKADRDMSLQGLAESMKAALTLHKNYPNNMEYLKGKQAVATKFKSPDDFPTLRGKYKPKLDYAGKVAQSCMHCHQVRDAERQIYRSAGKPIPDRLLLPNPSPAVIGLTFDPRTRATIRNVKDASAGALAGFKKGDELLTLNGQAILSTADIQWVLHHSKSKDQLGAQIRRDGQTKTLTLQLDEGWRSATDISWRVSSWELRRMGTGGILFEPATVEQRRQARVSDKRLAVVIKHLGKYGPHGAALRAGFRKGDMVVIFDGKTGDMTPSQLLAYTAQHTIPGQKIPVTVVRGNKRIKLMLPMQ